MAITDSLVITRTIEKIKILLGNTILHALEDPKTVELMLNSDCTVWVEKLGSGMEELCQMSSCSSLDLIQTVASFHSKIANETHPVLECEFPLDGSRFAAQLFPCVKSPTFTIRKKAVSIFTLSQYVENGVMSENQKNIILNAVKNHQNILIVGGTGSGKTTLVNAVIEAMVQYNPKERLVIIEDTGEIQCSAKNNVQFHTSPNVSMTDLLKTTLRMRPDRILVGEVRGPEALDLLMAWNTGHEGGAATVHANNPVAALERIALLISMNRDYPKPIEPLIASCVHVIVHITRVGHDRKIASILKVNGYDNFNKCYLTEEIT